MIFYHHFIKELDNHKLYIIEEIDNFNSKTNILVKCKICGYEFKTNYNRVVIQGAGCAVCKNKKVLQGVNDIWTTNPEIANLLYDKKDGFKYTYSSNKKVKWICPFCNNIIEKTINNIYNRGLFCSNCSDGISYPEKFIRNLLSLFSIDFICQKRFDWSDNRKYDFYLPETNTIIEVNGIQHYEETSKFTNRTLKEEQDNDKYKKEIALLNGIKNYIILDCRFSNCNWIKNSINNSVLLSLLNIDTYAVDWNYIDLNSKNSFIHETCQMYNKGICKNDILNTLKISDSTYRNYLKIGTKNNLCNYNAKLEQINAGKRSLYYCKKPILCITTSKKFDSIKNAALYYDIKPSYLALCLRKNKEFCGVDNITNRKLKWKLLEVK